MMRVRKSRSLPQASAAATAASSDLDSRFRGNPEVWFRLRRVRRIAMIQMLGRPAWLRNSGHAIEFGTLVEIADWGSAGVRRTGDS